MKVAFSARFQRSYDDAPERVREDFDKQLHLLLSDFRYPSLHVKKYSEAEDIWQARVNRTWRCYFQIKNNTYYFVDIMLHPK